MGDKDRSGPAGGMHSMHGLRTEKRQDRRAQACGQRSGRTDGRKPLNIIYIMSDDHSYQTISAYGHGLIETPNIDRLADSGVIFTQSFVANSISGPSRACLLTGKHSHKNGFTDNTRTFDGSQQTFPKLLRQAGYETAVIGKWHLTSDPTGAPRHPRLRHRHHHRPGPRLAGARTRPSETVLPAAAPQGPAPHLDARHH